MFRGESLSNSALIDRYYVILRNKSICYCKMNTYFPLIPVLPVDESIFVILDLVELVLVEQTSLGEFCSTWNSTTLNVA